MVEPHDGLSDRKRQLYDALARGVAQGLETTAVYLPGQDVRCPRAKQYPSGISPCGGWLTINSSADYAIHVTGKPGNFAERRKGPRSCARCQRCEGYVEVSYHPLREVA